MRYQIDSTSIAIVVISWLLTTIVFTIICTSCITSFMSLTTQRPEINTLNDVATNPNYQPVVHKGVTAEFIFLV